MMIIACLRYALRTRRWSARIQRDFMSNSPVRQERVRELATQVVELLAGDSPGQQAGETGR